MSSKSVSRYRMKIFFYGTHLKHYYLAKWLRTRGHQCTLLLTERNIRNLPEASDEYLSGNYPEWIIEDYENPTSVFRKFFRYSSQLSLMPFIFLKLLNYFEITPSNLSRKLASEHDLVFTSGSINVIRSFRFNKPVVFRALGSDLTQMPFSSKNLQKEFVSYYFRKNVSKIDKILAYQEDTYWAARFLNISDKIRAFSIPTDVHFMEKAICKNTYNEVSEKYAKYENVLFFPSRKNLEPTLPNYKGTEKALDALEKLVQKDGAEFHCVATEHGMHFNQFYDELVKRNLLDRFDFISPQPLTKLSAYISQDNFITINDLGFEKSHLTGIGREAVSLGALIIDSANTKSENFKHLYSDELDEMFFATTSKEVENQLERIFYLSKDDRKIFKKRVRAWAIKNLHWENTIANLESELTSMIKNVV